MMSGMRPFVVNLGTPTNGQKGTAQTHTVTITDASDPPVIGFSSLLVDDGTAEADQAAADFDLKDIIALTPKSGRDLQFTYKTEVDGNGATATAGQDYTAIDGTFTIAAGQTAPASSMILDILDESVDEDDAQTVKVTIAVVGSDQDGDGEYETTGAANTASDGNMVFTYTINDDDAAPNAYFKNVDVTADSETGTVTEGGAKTVTVELSSASERDITLYYSDNGTGDATATDYTSIANYTKIPNANGDATAPTITGNAGTTEATFAIATTPDDIDEGAGGNDYQTVVVRLYTTTSSTSDMATISNATAGGGAGVESVQLYTLQILDDDDLPVVNFTNGTGYTTDGDDKTDIAESGSSVDLYFELSRATERTVTIPFTFTDYGTIRNGAQGSCFW